jgi:hypothetical protein
MRYLYTLIILFIIIFFSSCRKDFTTSLSTGDLSFSQDTIFFNRVFDDISSSTHQFTVKNNSDKDISIPSISLERGTASFYRLNVDGVSGKSFNDVTILAKDSIYVFAEVTIDFDQVSDLEFMYRDKILFDSGINEQKVTMEAQVLDVHLIRPDRQQVADGFNYEEIILGQDEEGEDVGIRGTNLTENTLWANDKPYLIYNYVGVPSGITLTIEAGTRLHFHQNSGIIVQNGGKLIVEGTLSTTDEMENQVIFQGDRLEEGFAEVAGQWGTIWLMEGSANSEINYATIKNATIGLLVDSDNSIPTLTLNNSQIYNTSSFGIFARNAKLTAKNTVISNNGDSSFSVSLGGAYNLTHCTIANYWNSSNRQNPTLVLTDYFETNTALYVAKLDANLTNCIIYGNQSREFALENKDESTPFNFQFKNCLIKFNDATNEFADKPLYNFDNSNFYLNNLFNEEPNFFNTAYNYEDEIALNLTIGDESLAINQADTSVLTDVILQKDILGVERNVGNSDIGAYQHITFPEEE